MRETRDLEFKESVSNSFLKTVSAFANYGNGQILFGVTDAGEYKGIENPGKVCLNIENMINDSIDPQPEYTLEIDEKTNVIILNVKKGQDTPYLYKGKAYRRNDSSTIAVDKGAFRQLTLSGCNLSFDELKTPNQDLTFMILEKALQESLGIEVLTQDLLATLELYNRQEGYNYGAELLADKNHFLGIDIARFGESINIILRRYIYEKESIISQYQKAMIAFEEQYEYEEIRGATRNRVERLPKEAFREAIANALVHRDWDSPGSIQVSMFDDYIRITSPGGLTDSMSEEDYLESAISRLRNPIIGNVFFRLRFIERYGTGVQRIIAAYQSSKRKPTFKVSDTSIEVVLPIFEQNLTGISEDAIKVYELIRRGVVKTSTLVEVSGYGKTKIMKHIRELLAQGYITRMGSSRSTWYQVK